MLVRNDLAITDRLYMLTAARPDAEPVATINSHSSVLNLDHVRKHVALHSILLEIGQVECLRHALQITQQVDVGNEIAAFSLRV